MSSFWSRILVALAGLPAVVGLLWLGGWWLFALVLVVALIALHELYSMTRNLRPLVLAGYAGALLAGFMGTLALAFLLKGIAETRPPTTVSVGTTVLGVGWVAVGLGHLLLLRSIPEHAQLATLTVVVAVFASDTAAYFTGRLLGRHKLAPLISPGKTWEGFIAGTIVAVLVAFFAMYKQHFLVVWESLLLGLVIAVAAPIGDLFESGIKRDMEVKDTGTLLAGHGGMLDRIDAQLFAVVAAFYTLVGLGYA
jgi:phosphatidate cytidylyltransferase